jgi:hypothetical protein
LALPAAHQVRHCLAAITLTRKVLGDEPQVRFHQGLMEFAEWLKGQVADRMTPRMGVAHRGGARASHCPTELTTP